MIDIWKTISKTLQYLQQLYSIDKHFIQLLTSIENIHLLTNLSKD